jgi:hypothetical protein
VKRIAAAERVFEVLEVKTKLLPKNAIDKNTFDSN